MPLEVRNRADCMPLEMQVVPLYCFDPRHFMKTPWGNPKTGQYRAQFLLESVLDLKQSLRNIGSDLIVHLGKPEDAIAGGHRLHAMRVIVDAGMHHSR